MPRLSVIMAVYNDASLPQAIESILTQTYSDFEFLIVDDGSTDATPAILKDYASQDARIRVITKAHAGLTKALNRGIQESSGAYLARMDADDVADKTRLALQVAYLDAHPTIGLCGTQGRYISEKGSALGKKQLPTTDAAIKRKLLFNNQFIHSSWMLRREVVDALGAYDESFIKSQDYEFAFRIACTYAVANLSEPLISWRVRSASLSWSGKAQEWHAIRARWYAITRHGYAFLPGLFHILLRFGWLCVPQRVKIKRYAS